MSAAVVARPGDLAGPGIARCTPARRLTANEWRRRDARLASLRYDRRQALSRARNAVGYIRARLAQFATETSPTWRAYLASEIEHTAPYITRLRAEAAALLRDIRALSGAANADADGPQKDSSCLP